MPRNSVIKTGRWSVRFSSGSQYHGPNLHSEANLREILEVWQRSLCMLCRSLKKHMTEFLGINFRRLMVNCCAHRGAETRGGISPPIIWLYPPPNNLNGCTVHLSENWGKSVLFLMKTFFFGLHLNLGKKKCSIFNEDLFFLVFT